MRLTCHHHLASLCNVSSLLSLSIVFLVIADRIESLQATTTTTTTTSAKCSPKSCKTIDGDDLLTGNNNNNGRPVCGSDGFTYPNRCLLELTRCSTKTNTTTLTFARRGPCAERVKCTNATRRVFRAKCREDGAFAASQCNPAIGYCWCVTPQGLPLPYTVIKHDATAGGGSWPKCGKHRKSTTRRSSRPKKAAKPCRRADKAQFNANLIRTVHTEWSRDRHPLGVDPGTDLDRIVLEWKFNKMDEDKNGNLDKNEYRTLRRLVKKAVKPLKCAKQFPKSCDVDRNEYVSRTEWVDCLSRDGMDDGRSAEQNEEDEDEDEEDDGGGDDFFTTPSQPPHGVLDTRLSSGGPSFEEESSEKKDDDSTDCFSDRQTALGEQRADKRYELYIPECTPDGRYKKIQCYNSAGYCWCVHEDTGKNIPGTSVKNGTPQCDQMMVASRPMKGCPDDKKITFISDLMDFFHRKMARETNGTNMAGANGPAWKVSREEQVATWSFVVYDKNKNKMLDKNEWKAFKDTVSAVKTLRKCGKKLPRYCDINKDRQISMTEWLDCLNTNRIIPEIATATTLSPGSIRTGKNPLSVLMED